MRLDVIKLSDIKPDENNPRKDFGDLQALADTFAFNTAYPGEPITPPIVVQDGSIYRLVDGECRYRAMCLIGQETCHVQVLESQEEYSVVTAALVTNEKKPLSEEERARGVQMMIIAGTDTDKLEKNLHVKHARKIKRGLELSGNKQMDMNQLIAAADADEAGYPSDADAILEADEKSWRSVADALEKEHKLSERFASLIQVCGKLDIPVVYAKAQGEEPPADSVHARGLYLFSTYDEDDMKRYADGRHFVFVNGGDLTEYCCTLYLSADGAKEEEIEQAARDEKTDIVKRLYAKAYYSRWLALRKSIFNGPSATNSARYLHAAHQADWRTKDGLKKAMKELDISPDDDVLNCGDESTLHACNFDDLYFQAAPEIPTDMFHCMFIDSWPTTGYYARCNFVNKCKPFYEFYEAMQKDGIELDETELLEYIKPYLEDEETPAE